LAQDIVDHFEQRIHALDGKAMVVCMSRRICVELYKEIVGLRPGWHQDDDDKGKIKVVMTGSASDPPDGSLSSSQSGSSPGPPSQPARGSSHGTRRTGASATAGAWRSSLMPARWAPG
jgi:hypothetical protein